MSKNDPKISVYMVWILVGIFLKYKLSRLKKNKKIYYFISPSGEFKSHLQVHDHGVETLLKAGLIHKKENDENETFVLTNTGFELVWSKMGKLREKQISEELFIG